MGTSRRARTTVAECSSARCEATTAVVDGRQEVAVHDEERLVEVLDQVERAGRPQWLDLDDVLDPQTEALAIAEERLDQLRHVSECQNDTLESLARKLLQDDLHRRLVTERE